MSFSDSHCHLDRASPEILAGMLKQAREKQVEIVVSMSSSLQSAEETIIRAKANKGMYVGVGIHPWNAVHPDVTVSDRLTALTKEHCVVAIGEIGLDYQRNPDTKELQKELLHYELDLAFEKGLPVNIHCREAHKDMMDILHREARPGLKGIMHGFQGDLTMLKDWLDLGFYISIGYRGFISNEIPSLLAAIPHIPSDRLLTETDSAGGQQPSGPVDVVQVIKKLASLRGTTAKQIGNTATQNLERVLGRKL